MRTELAVLAVCLLGVSCGPGPTKTKPLASSVAGVYVPSEKTLTDMDKRFHLPISQHEFVLYTNGLFVASNVPDWLTGRAVAVRSLVTKKGTWELEERNNAWVVTLAYDGMGFYVPLRGQTPPYTLNFPLGDKSYYLVFVRKK